MKYYYKGQLIRTSDNEYKFALLLKKKDGSFKTMKCSKSFDVCIREFNYLTKAQTIAEQYDITIEEAFNTPKFKLWSSQLHTKDSLIIVELVRGA